MEFRSDAAHLEHLWVEPVRIRRGVGRTLLAMACDDARDRGYSALEMVADPNAEPFYLHHGATRVGEVHSTVLGTPRVLPKMRLKMSGLTWFLETLISLQKVCELASPKSPSRSCVREVLRK